MEEGATGICQVCTSSDHDLGSLLCQAGRRCMAHRGEALLREAEKNVASRGSGVANALLLDSSTLGAVSQSGLWLRGQATLTFPDVGLTLGSGIRPGIPKAGADKWEWAPGFGPRPVSCLGQMAWQVPLKPLRFYTSSQVSHLVTDSTEKV